MWLKKKKKEKKSLAMQETWVQSLGCEDLLQKEMATHSSILAWKIPWTEEPGWLQSMGLQRVGHDWVTNTYSTYKLNKQGDNTEPWCTHFPVLNQCIVPCSRRQVRWSGIPISLRIFQFVVIHTVKAFSVVNEAEVDVFLEFPCFICDAVDVGNLISDSSAISKSSLYI